MIHQYKPNWGADPKLTTAFIKVVLRNPRQPKYEPDFYDTQTYIKCTLNEGDWCICCLERKLIKEYRHNRKYNILKCNGCKWRSAKLVEVDTK